MMVQTTVGVPMDAKLLDSYLHRLVGRFYKILPLKEEGEKSLNVYIKSLQAELLGFNKVACVICNDSLILSLVSILQYLSDEPECETDIVRREVFHAISICKKLEEKYKSVSEEVVR